MAWLKKDSRLRGHHKLIACADDLDLKPVYLEGHLDSFWLACLERFEDGDVSSLTNVQIAILAEYNSKHADRFVQALQKHRWLDDHLIHDWLDYVGDYLKSKYRKSPGKLAEIYRKHGREEELKKKGSSGTCTGHVPDTSGTSQEVDLGLYELKTPNPSTQDQEEKKNSNKGGVGENAAAPPAEPQQRVLSSFLPSGSRVPGSYIPSEKEIPWEELTVDQVFHPFYSMFSLNGVRDARDFQRLVNNAKVCPARWAMLFIDKVAYAYGKDDSGKIRLDEQRIDPVALTAAGFRPREGGRSQSPTESASGLFKEVFIDKTYDLLGRGKRWKDFYGEGIAHELEKRKGKKSGRSPHRKVSVEWTCDVCGYSAVGVVDEGVVLNSHPCGAGNGCQGTMEPKKIEGSEG